MPVISQPNATSPVPSTSTQSPSESEKDILSRIRYLGKKFRVRLSYPENQSSISFSSYAGNVAFAYLDHRRKPIYPGTTVSVTPGSNGTLDVTIAGFTESVKTFSYSAGVVAIDSWMRIPAWDRSRQYNDNLFRDTIEVINENGNMLVINHLPLEWYLKGL